MEAFTDHSGSRRTLVVMPEPVQKSKRLRKPLEAYQRVIDEQRAANVRLSELFANRERAEAAQLEAEGEAIFTGSTLPVVKETGIAEEILQLEGRLEAIEVAFGRAELALAEAFEEERGALLQEAEKRTQAAGDEYAAAVTKLEERRLEFFGEKRIATWIGSFPRERKGMPSGQPAVSAIQDAMSGEALSFDRLIGALRGELEGPVAVPGPREVTLPLRVAS